MLTNVLLFVYPSRKGYVPTAFKLLLLACLIQALPLNYCLAMSDIEDSVNVYVGSNLIYDSNFLRISNHVNPTTIIGKTDTSEFLKVVTAGIDINKRYNDQLFKIKANANQNFFQNFTRLDYTGWDDLAQWDWRMTKRFSGKFGYTNKEMLGSYSQLNSLIDNLRNDANYFADAGYLFHPSGRVKVGFNRYEATFDSVQRQASNKIEDAAFVSLQYLTATKNILGIKFASAQGQYPQRNLIGYYGNNHMDNAYNKYDYSFTWEWMLDRVVKLDGFIGYVQQNYVHYADRNYDGIIGKFAVNWLISSKLGVDMIIDRQLVQMNTIQGTFMLAQGIELTPTWQFSPKVAVKLPLKYQQQQYLGQGTDQLQLIGVNNLQQENNTETVGINLMYSPIQNLNVSAIFSYENRDSNVYTRTYLTQSAGLTLDARF